MNEQSNILSYYSTNTDELVIHNFETDSIMKAWNLPSYSFADTDFLPDGKSLYILNGRSGLKKINTETLEVEFTKGERGPTSTPRELDISPTGDSIVFNYSDSFNLIDKNGQSLNFTPFTGNGSLSQEVRFSPSGQYIALISEFNKGYIYNSKTQEEFLPKVFHLVLMKNITQQKK